MTPRVLLIAMALVVGLSGAACGGGDDADPTTTSLPRRVDIAALGDSFSAGEGAPPYDTGSGSCHRSPQAWPRLLDDQATTGSALSVDVELLACAGAQTQHLTDPWRDRDLPAQIPAVVDPDIDIVYLTIGGNDVGFSAIVLTCVLLQCPEASSSSFTTALGDLRVHLETSVYPALVAAYPNAAILHVGYPHLTPAPGEAVQGCSWLDATDQGRAGQVVDALNATIEAASQEAGLDYVDVTDALAGHELCTSDSWVVPIGGDGQAHPTSPGQQAIADVVRDELLLLTG